MTVKLLEILDQSDVSVYFYLYVKNLYGSIRYYLFFFSLAYNKWCIKYKYQMTINDAWPHSFEVILLICHWISVVREV